MLNALVTKDRNRWVWQGKFSRPPTPASVQDLRHVSGQQAGMQCLLLQLSFLKGFHDTQGIQSVVKAGSGCWAEERGAHAMQGRNKSTFHHHPAGWVLGSGFADPTFSLAEDLQTCTFDLEQSLSVPLSKLGVLGLEIAISSLAVYRLT